jgi:AbrB family looped-hinge helix DNA binding protein
MICWYRPTMRSTIDFAGRVVIPKELRERLALEGGSAVEICERDGRIEIAPIATNMSLVARPGGGVAVSGQPLPPLTDDIVRDTLDKTRR